MRGGHGNLSRAAALAADLRTSLELPKILGKADPDLLKLAILACHAKHARPQPRICGNEGADNVDWRPGLHFIGRSERDGNGDYIAGAADIGKIVGGTLARTGAMFRPFVPGKRLAWIKVTRAFQRDA